ncbi:MAG: CPBP family glutamic-type intramembrane protease [Coprobacillus sp.]
MISNAFIGIIVCPTYLAAVSILKGNNKEIAFYNHSRKKELFWTFICIFICGSFLACLNLALSLGSYQLDLSFQPMFIFHALRAGIFEEIIFRMFLFALCIEITGNLPYNKSQEMLCYLLMILPHVLLHFSNTIDIVSIIILAIFFGLPFCLMQRKINLLSAIGAHSMVDFIRFIMLGI